MAAIPITSLTTEETLNGFVRQQEDKSVAGSSRVIGFLDKADDAYMLAFDSKNIKPFAPYADPAVCTAVLQEILSGEDRYFGTSKLRKRSWEIVLDDGRTVRAVKHVGHEAINCGHGSLFPWATRSHRSGTCPSMGSDSSE